MVYVGCLLEAHWHSFVHNVFKQFFEELFVNPGGQGRSGDIVIFLPMSSIMVLTDISEHQMRDLQHPHQEMF